MKVKGDPDSVPNQFFGQLPILTHGDFTLAQSRYANGHVSQHVNASM